MEKKTEMDFRQVEQIMEESKGGVIEKKESLISHGNNNHPTNAVESSTALQLFLDHIPISSIPGINNSSAVLELKTGDFLGDAIRLLYEKNVFGAPIADIPLDTETTTGQKLLDHHIGFIDFARLVLWSLEECEKAGLHTKEKSSNGIFSMLEQNLHIAQTKIGELAKSFLWDPFFPVHLDDTLFHVLLLLSKHRVQFVPVTEQSTSAKVTGFVTQNAVIHLLLQSSGLEWFDSIADKALSDFRFEHDKHAVLVYGDQSITETMHSLWESQIGVVAVIERETEKLIGCVRNSDLHLLLDNNDLFNNRKTLTAEKFIHVDAGKVDSDPTIERDLGAFISAGVLALRNNFIPRMDSPVTNQKTDSLKQAMKNLTATKCNFCFLVDELQKVQGVVTLRDLIIQFAPPSMDSRINGGGFFDSALEQTGCHIEEGTMICNH